MAVIKKKNNDASVTKAPRTTPPELDENGNPIVAEENGEIPIPQTGWPNDAGELEAKGTEIFASDFPTADNTDKGEEVVPPIPKATAPQPQPDSAHLLLKAPVIPRKALPLSEIAKLPPGQQPKNNLEMGPGSNVDGKFNEQPQPVIPPDVKAQFGEDHPESPIDIPTEEEVVDDGELGDPGLEKPPVNNRYLELKALLDAKRDKLAQERDAAKLIADPMEKRAYELDNTEGEVEKTGDNRLYGQLANMASLGIDKSTQFIDKEFNSGESRRLNTDMSMNLERQLQARQMLANRLRARAQENRLRPAVEGGKYAQTEGLDINNISNREMNPIRAQNTQSLANMNDRKDRGMAETFDTDVESHLKNSEANNSKNQTVIDTEGNRKIKSDEEAKREPMTTARAEIDNALATNRKTVSDITTADATRFNTPDSQVVGIVADSLASNLRDLSNDETDLTRKAELKAIAERVATKTLTYTDLEAIKKQFPDLNLKKALAAAAKGVKEAPVKYLDPGQQKEMNVFNTTLENMRDTILNPQRMKTGRIQTLKEWAKSWVGAGDPEWAAFAGNVNSSVSAYIKDLSGAGVTNNEREDLQKQLPSTNDSPEVFEAQLKRVFNQIARKRKDYLGMAQVGGRTVEGQPADPARFDNSFTVESGGKKETKNKNVDTTFNATPDGKVTEGTRKQNNNTTTLAPSKEEQDRSIIGMKVGQDLPDLPPPTTTLPKTTIQQQQRSTQLTDRERALEEMKKLDPSSDLYKRMDALIKAGNL